jgi:tRNA (guanine-N7-)-methyltransferase
MSRKKKLQRFAEMEAFPNVLQPRFNEVFRKDHSIKTSWNKTLFKNDHPVVLELGCGKGEYTTGLARHFPQKNFIGVDIKGARIWKGARQALSENLGNVRFLRTHIEHINSFFGPDEVDEIWITFPDPQLRKRRKRLTSPGFLTKYSRFLRQNGIVHLKTDNEILYKYTLELAKISGFTIRYQTSDLYHSGISDEILEIKTFYEQQYLDLGMNIHYLSFELPHEKKIEEPPEEKPG